MKLADKKHNNSEKSALYIKKSDDAKNKNYGLKYVKSCVKGYGALAAVTPVFIVLEAALELFIPLLMAAIVDGGLSRKSDYVLSFLFPSQLFKNQNAFIITVGVIMLAASFLSMFFGLGAARSVAYAGAGFAKNIRKKLFYKIQTFSFSNIDGFSDSSLVNRLTSDVNNIQGSFQTVLIMLVRAPVMLVLSSVTAIAINPRLSILFVGIIPLIAVLFAVMFKTAGPRFRKMLVKHDKMNSDVRENLTAIRVVKSFAKEKDETEKFAKSGKELCDAQIKAQKIFSFSNPIQLFIMYATTVLLYLFGGKEVIYGDFNYGELITMVSYASQIIGSLTMISFMFVMLSMSKASLDRINEVFSTQPDINDGDFDGCVQRGEIEFKDVSFAYNHDGKSVLKNINIKINAGETIGIIGGTGEGKSSLVRLIPRFYDCDSGCIYIDGVDVRRYSLKKLRDGVSFVLQTNTLFSGTIEDNIKWGDENASREDVEKACVSAQADEFICSFKDGYSTMLGQGGVNVSGGQKQRLCIARALLKKPKIIVLDDSTSAVDTATDEKIRNGLKETLKGTTTIIIAQRVASLVNADRIIVMKNGEINAVGTHDSLLESNEIYRDVYQSQCGGKNNA